MIGRREIAAGVAIMVAFIIAAVVLGSAWQNHSDQQQAAQDARQARAAAHRLAVGGYRQDIKRWHDLQRGCARSVRDRLGSIRLLTFSARANQAVADDNVNTWSVRHYRGLEAAAQRRAIRGLRLSVPGKDPRKGFSCLRAYPKPPAPSGVTPLP
jgi:hypothetical protein